MPELAPAMMSDAHRVLAQAGLRATSPRLAIWQALNQSEDEPDAVELLRRAQPLEPRTSLGTVYRFLRELEQHALASSRPVAHGRARWRAGLSSGTTASRNDAAVAAVARLAAAYGYRLVPSADASSTT